jgi:oligopeptide transport system substrate-binding protein
VTLSQPVPYFLSLLTHPSLSPLHQASMEQYGNQWTQPGKLVGNGAFVLSHRVVNEKLELTPNPYYWDRAHTVLTASPSCPSTRERGHTPLSGRDLHITESFPKEQYQSLMAQIPGEVYTPEQLGTYYYAFNTQRAPQRRSGSPGALLHHRQGPHCRQGAGHRRETGYHFTPDVTAGFEPKPNLLSTSSQQALDERPDPARGGLRPGQPLRLTLLYNTAEIHKKMALAIANLWKQKLGARVELTNQEWKTYLDSRQSGQFEVIRSSWVADYNDPSAFLGSGDPTTAATWPGSPTRLTTSCWRRRPTARIPESGPVCSMRPRPSCRRRPHRPHLPVHQCPAHQALAQGVSHQQPGRRGLQPSALPRQTLSPGRGTSTPPDTVLLKFPA